MPAARTCDWNIGHGARCEREVQTAVTGRPLCFDHAHFLRTILLLRELCDFVIEVRRRRVAPDLDKRADGLIGRANFLIEEIAP